MRHEQYSKQIFLQYTAYKATQSPNESPEDEDERNKPSKKESPIA
ncbi:hypothetical protein OsccyDRAFT_5047 [Leptolyngbyaceae cyanobacterium JSC-12]|nr:hypothetical protein OsccyDRAFT_5053 [Leptolyngbyaceae cyanobacterium JSC-12]EKQ67214.1 hypothetical protein OsccyDRAFT_5047 [Leptolyngbyaceae cyanobacterium JSC-12]